MPQDPNQPPSGQNEYPYGDPADPARNTPAANPYDNAQNPFGASQYPYEEPQNANPFGASQYPYEEPQNANPYQASQYPYAEPQNARPNENQQNANPYEVPAGYGAVGVDPNLGYLPEGSPLPLGEAIRQLPQQYRQTITRPSATIFALEKGKASWDIVWVQLLGYAIIVALLGLLANFINPNRYPGYNATQISPVMLQAISTGTSIGLILIIPLSFFITVGILHLIAKAFKGQGTFLQYAYSLTLFTVPLGIIGGVLALIPFVGVFLSFAISIYELVLYVFATMGVYRLSGGKATMVVLLPTIVLFLLLCAFLFIVVLIIGTAARGVHP